MPVGVNVQTSSLPGPSTTQVAPTATYFVVGQTERGSVTAPTVVHSPSEYAALLGARVTYGTLFDDLTNYFAEGGTQAYVARVVGPAATSGLLAVQDASAVPTLRFTAASPGAWSSQLSVQIVNPDGVTGTFAVLLFLNGVQVDRKGNLATPAAAVLAFAGSPYVTVTNLNSVTAAPGNNPATLAATPLSAGSGDTASVTSSLLIAALSQFTADMGAGMVAIPGQPVDTVASSIASHCQTYNRVGATAPSAGTSVASVQASAANLRNNAACQYLGLIYPWVVISDGQGGTRTVSPEGFVAGLRARAIVNQGVWQEPMGAFGASKNLVGVEQLIDRPTNSALYDANVSGILPVLGGVRLYGYRSLSPDLINYRLLRDRDILNYFAVVGAQALESFVGQTIDGKGQFFAGIQATLQGLCEPMRLAGGLYPLYAADGVTQIDPGYLIDTGPDVNPVSQLRQDIAGVSLAIRPSPQADLINVSIVKVAVGTPT